jgi:DNA-binding MarR family transcriptional regulator
MFDYLIATGSARNRSLAARRLTPNDARALHFLDRKNGQPMGALARAWDCDPSMVTWIVGRLERLGLAERAADPDDGRVKRVVLSPKGERTKAELMAEFHAPPPEVARLSKIELESIRQIAEKLLRDRAALPPER